MNRWSGRVALVTGASVGIGAEICKTLVETGMKVIGVARGVDQIQKLAVSLKDAKGSLLAIKCDLTKDDDIYKLFKEIKWKFGGVDICINNAGFSMDKTLLNGTPEDWRCMTGVNIISLCLCTKLAVASMRERGVDDGHIINISSIGGHFVAPYSEAHFYMGTKFAVRAITEGLRQEIRELKLHIRVTAVSPGAVLTEFAARMMGKEKAQAMFESFTKNPLVPEDVAATVLYIISSPPHVEINDVIIRPTDQQL